MSERHILIAGGGGFLGSHLCDALLARGDRVTCVDDFSSGDPANVAQHADDDRFTLIEADVSTLEPPADVRFTHVMHLASPASPPEYLRRPLDTLRVNSIGTERLLELARRDGARFFLASTSEVYGDPLIHPQTETYWGNVNPIGERSVYDEAKRYAEAITMAYHREYDLDVAIVRIFNTYGPRMQADDGRVVTNFINQALSGDAITMYGDGSQTRSFCYVDDEIRGFVALLDSTETGPINIGNPNEFTMLQLANLVTEQIGTASDIVFQPLPSDDPRVRQPDISVARTRLGWQPQVELTEGLERTIDWFRAARSATG